MVYRHPLPRRGACFSLDAADVMNGEGIGTPVCRSPVTPSQQLNA